MSPKTRADKTQLDLFKAATAVAEPPAPQPDAEPEAGTARGRRPPRSRPTAEALAGRQREISISEFFTKNRHLLGFDNPRKALLTTVKEAVDNALDACEEAGILPDISIEAEELGESRYRVTIEDNGPGIVKQQIPKIFAKLLYGSKFHALKQSRGQQGIGISAAGMYGQLTTGKPVSILSKTQAAKPAHAYELRIDTQRNQPVIVKEELQDWEKRSGTRVSIELEATYQKGRRSVDDYVEQTATANPHARIRYQAPRSEPVVYERVTEELPAEPKSIKPHPHGVELGALIKMLHDSQAKTLEEALTSDFSRVSPRIARELAEKAGLQPTAQVRRLGHAQIEKLFRAIPEVRIMAPPADCLSPIGQVLLLEAFKSRVQGDFYATSSRAPKVYRGMPFQVEAGLAYSRELPAEETVELRRFANRVPLLYQQAACAISKAAIDVEWRNYGLSQSRGALPAGPVVLFVHIASVWVPFTSESKEAVAHYPEIVQEIRLGLMEVGRKLGGFLRARRRDELESKKRSYIEKYIPHIGIALQEILGISEKEEQKVVEILTDTLERSRKV